MRGQRALWVRAWVRRQGLVLVVVKTLQRWGLRQRRCVPRVLVVRACCGVGGVEGDEGGVVVDGGGREQGQFTPRL